MSNLLHAQFTRLFKSKLFYIGIVILVVIGVALPIITSFQYLALNREFYADRTVEDFFDDITPDYQGPPDYANREYSRVRSFDEDFFEMFEKVELYMDYYLSSSFYVYGVFAAILITALFSKEYRNGTIRNKVISGHSRASIYLSNLIVSITAEIIMHICYIIASFIPVLYVYLLFKDSNLKIVVFEYPLKEHLLIQLLGLGIIFLYSSLFIFITMIVDSQSRAITASMLIIVMSVLLSILAQDKVYGADYKMDIDDITNEYYYEVDDKRYTNYSEVMDAMRGKGLNNVEKFIYCTLDDCLTNCQLTSSTTIFMMGPGESLPSRMGVYYAYDFGLAAFFTIAGITLFSRKDLK